MHQLDGRLILAATDLSNFLACSHLTLLHRRTGSGQYLVVFGLAGVVLN